MSSIKTSIYEVNMSRRGFLKGASAQAISSMIPAPVLVIAKDIVNTPNVTISSLDILASFISAINKIGLNPSDIGYYLKEWTSDDWSIGEHSLDYDELREIQNRYNIMTDPAGNYSKKNTDKFWNIVDKYYRYPDHFAGDGPQWEAISQGELESPEQVDKRNRVFSKLLGRKTKITLLTEWARSLGYPTFDHLVASPSGRIIFDNIYKLNGWVRDEDGNIRDLDSTDAENSLNDSPEVKAAFDSVKSTAGKWRLLTLGISAAKKLLSIKSKGTSVSANNEPENKSQAANEPLALPAPTEPDILYPDVDVNKLRDLAGIKTKNNNDPDQNKKSI